MKRHLRFYGPQRHCREGLEGAGAVRLLAAGFKCAPERNTCDHVRASSMIAVMPSLSDSWERCPAEAGL